MAVNAISIKSAFLNGDKKEEVYVKQSSSFEIASLEGKVCRILKALYKIK